MATYDDYNSVMFEGKSLCSESTFGPKLAVLVGNTGMISRAASYAMSRAASRAGSINLGLGLNSRCLR